MGDDRNVNDSCGDYDTMTERGQHAVKILSHPRHRALRRVQSGAAGPGCGYMEMFQLSSVLTNWQRNVFLSYNRVQLAQI